MFTTSSLILTSCFGIFKDPPSSIIIPKPVDEDPVSTQDFDKAIIGISLATNKRPRIQNQDFTVDDLIREQNNLNNFLVYSIDPDWNNKINDFNLLPKIVPGSKNDDNGTIQIELEVQKPIFNETLFKKIYTVSGFKSNKNKSFQYKNKLKKLFSQELIKEKSNNNKKVFQYSDLKENFWDYFEIDKSILTKKNSNTYEKDNLLFFNFEFNHIDKNGVFWYSYEIEDKLTKEKFQNLAKLSNVNFTIINEDKNPLSDANFALNLKLENAKYFSTSFKELDSGKLAEKFDIQKKKSIFLAENYKLSVWNSASSYYDQNGVLLIKVKYLNFSRIFKFDVFSFNEISKNIFNLTKTNKNEINKNINLANKTDLAIYSLNFKDKTLRYKMIGEHIRNYVNGPDFEKHFFNYLESNSSAHKYLTIFNFNFEKETKKITFVFHNASGEEYELFIPLNPNENQYSKSIVSNFGDKTFSKEQIFKDIKNRTLSINYVVNDPNGTSRSIVSGTAWIFDRKFELDANGNLVPSNTYYLATNLHVLSELINKRDLVSSFSYSFNSKYDTIPTFLSYEEANNSKYSDVFRRFDRKLDESKYSWARKKVNNSIYITKESEEFWGNLKPFTFFDENNENNEYLDFAILEITFPNDYEYKVRNPFVYNFNGFNGYGDGLDLIYHIFNKPERARILKHQNIPDQVNYYNKNKPKFLISDKIIFENETLNNKENSENVIIPGNLYLGGYLGGHEWVEQESLAFVYKDNNILRQQNIIKDKKVFDLKTHTTDFILPNIKTGKGMSGSMVLNRSGQIVGILWGGFFDDKNSLNTQGNLVYGTGSLDTLSIKRSKNKTILRQWLDKTKNITTDLDAYENLISY
ncbi:Uncharacterised protein [Mesomycoplasma neurolyticum]|uniref:Uncharacterized protein n=2 Tax=Mesomycoplasma neurolyticum TaxID=2120 RepID=A0A449A678_9BACT|nr:Uncharacterised protein [Mesomycoplasma neurolyticum]